MEPIPLRFGVENLGDRHERTPLIQETPSPDPNDTSAMSMRPLPNLSSKKNTPYVLYLESLYNGEPVGTVYSNNMLNPNDEQLAEVLGDGMEGLVPRPGAAALRPGGPSRALALPLPFAPAGRGGRPDGRPPGPALTGAPPSGGDDNASTLVSQPSKTETFQ